MSKTLPRIIESVREELSNYHLTDDFPMPYEYLVDKAIDAREALIKEEIDAGKTLDSRYYQKVCCLEVTCHREGCTVNGQFIPSGSVTWEVKLPKLISGVGWLSILYLGTDEFKKSFTRKEFDAWMNLSGNIWTSTNPTFAVVGNSAYLKNMPTSDFKYICAILLLSNPVDSCEWKEDENEFPVPSDYKLQLLMVKDILSKFGVPKDKQDNATDPGAIAQPNTKENE
jgi:hypothetical protein